MFWRHFSDFLNYGVAVDIDRNFISTRGLFFYPLWWLVSLGEFGRYFSYFSWFFLTVRTRRLSETVVKLIYIIIIIIPILIDVGWIMRTKLGSMMRVENIAWRSLILIHVIILIYKTHVHNHTCRASSFHSIFLAFLVGRFISTVSDHEYRVQYHDPITKLM